MSRAHQPLKASEVAARYGLSARHWTRLAAAGKVPGAWQPVGARGHWLFNAEALDTWRKNNLKEVSQWQGFTSGATSGGAAPSVKIKSSGLASKQRIEQLLKSVLGNGSGNSMPSNGAISRGGRLTKLRSGSSEST
ncbi:helix-turn-helix domain-containing protein [Bradyrhizobium sp. URHD0069]|uniref:helix-turn-helix domain-containing protein n=1 Tax=Bradyrhizobium sp. URHD0069 TaxID=1380355 RepID=UPI00352971C3